MTFLGETFGIFSNCSAFALNCKFVWTHWYLNSGWKNWNDKNIITWTKHSQPIITHSYEGQNDQNTFSLCLLCPPPPPPLPPVCVRGAPSLRASTRSTRPSRRSCTPTPTASAGSSTRATPSSRGAPAPAARTPSRYAQVTTNTSCPQCCCRIFCLLFSGTRWLNSFQYIRIRIDHFPVPVVAG